MQPTKRSALTQKADPRSHFTNDASREATTTVRSPFSGANPLETSAANVSAPMTSARRIESLSTLSVEGHRVPETRSHHASVIAFHFDQELANGSSPGRESRSPATS